MTHLIIKLPSCRVDMEIKVPFAENAELSKALSLFTFTAVVGEKSPILSCTHS